MHHFDYIQSNPLPETIYLTALIVTSNGVQKLKIGKQATNNSQDYDRKSTVLSH